MADGTCHNGLGFSELELWAVENPGLLLLDSDFEQSILLVGQTDDASQTT